MSEGKFAPWVEPIADHFRLTRREVIELAREVPAGQWEVASPVTGWRFRDVLAHMAEADTFLRMVIQAVLDGSSTDMRPRSAERETRISKALERGEKLALDDLIRRCAREGDFTQELLSRLTAEDETSRVITSRTNPAPMTLREFLESYHHDEEHFQHLLPAVPRESLVR